MKNNGMAARIARRGRAKRRDEKKAALIMATHIKISGFEKKEENIGNIYRAEKIISKEKYRRAHHEKRSKRKAKMAKYAENNERKIMKKQHGVCNGEKAAYRRKYIISKISSSYHIKEKRQAASRIMKIISKSSRKTLIYVKTYRVNISMYIICISSSL